MVKPLSKIAWQFNEKVKYALTTTYPSIFTLCVYPKEKKHMSTQNLIHKYS